MLSHSVYSRMHSAYPDFAEKLEKHGLFYIRIMGEGDDPSSPIGRGWQSTFLTKDKSEAEKRLGMHFLASVFFLNQFYHDLGVYLSWHVEPYT